MAGFLYFIPNRPAVSDADMQRLGLSSVLGDGTPPCVGGKGPEGMTGVFCVLSSVPESREDGSKYMRHDKAAQTWRKCEKGAYWLGYWNDDKPGPQDLMREEAVGGHTVRLEDGSVWTIPLAMVMGGGTAFATKLTLNDNGEWINGSVEDRFASICERAEDVFEFWMYDAKAAAGGEDEAEDGESAERPVLVIADLYDLAADALAVNYHVGKHEVDALNIFTDHNAVFYMTADNILGALIDFPTIVDTLKKNAASERIDGGEED